MAVALDTQPKDKPALDEVQCKASLARLERLQDQIDNLRTVIPRMIKPLLETQASPQDLFQGFKRAADDAAKELRQFRADWRDDNTQNVLREARKSYEANCDLRPADNVPRYGWSDDGLVDESEVAMPNGESMSEEDDGQARSIGDMRPALEEFRAGHADWVVELNAEEQRAVLQAPASHRNLQFVLKLEKGGLQEHLEVECTGDSKFAQAVTRSIASRPYDLRYLLDMLASYIFEKDTKCSACGNMIDRKGLTPAARRKRQAKSSDGSTTIVWEPYHEGCL